MLGVYYHRADGAAVCPRAFRHARRVGAAAIRRVVVARFQQRLVVLRHATRVLGADAVGPEQTLRTRLLHVARLVVRRDHRHGDREFMRFNVIRFVARRVYGRTLLRPLPHLFHPPVQHGEYPDVEYDGDEERDVEGTGGRVQDVCRGLVEHAVVYVGDIVVHVRLAQVVPAEQRRQADRERNYPHAADVDGRLLRRALLVIPDRVERRRETVERDDAQVPDGRRAVQHVDAQPEVAHRRTEHPITETLIDRR